MKNIYKALIMTLAILWVGCQKEGDFLEKHNPNSVTTETFLKSDADAEKLANGIYAVLQTGSFYNHAFFNLHGTASDEALAKANNPPDWGVYKYNLTTTTQIISAYWRGLYGMIYRANFAIAKVKDNPAVSQEMQDWVLGQAYFLRGYSYFSLAADFGRAPIITKLPEKPDDRHVARSQTELEVWQQAEKDLLEAEKLLPFVYKTDRDLGRATKGSAVGMLGKLYLYWASPGLIGDQSKYANAITYFSKLVDEAERTQYGNGNIAGGYALMENYWYNFDNIHENNKESLFEVQMGRFGEMSYSWDYGDGWIETEGNQQGRTWGFNDWWNAVLTRNIIDMFPDTDPRKKFTGYAWGDSAKGGAKYSAESHKNNFAIKKYTRYEWLKNDDGNSDVNHRVLRYADILLMYAEALNASTSQQAKAVELINAVRTRTTVNVAPLAANLTQDLITEAIRQERVLELTLEEVRRRDLIRWGKTVAEAALKYSGKDLEGSNFNYDIHKYFPIPQYEIDVNSAISNSDQNPGY